MNQESHINLGNPFYNHENLKNHRNHLEKEENNENLRNPCDNKKNI